VVRALLLSHKKIHHLQFISYFVECSSGYICRPGCLRDEQRYRHFSVLAKRVRLHHTKTVLRGVISMQCARGGVRVTV